eukprot:6320063-Prymnesium_polylepis.1
MINSSQVTPCCPWTPYQGAFVQTDFYDASLTVVESWAIDSYGFSTYGLNSAAAAAMEVALVTWRVRCRTQTQGWVELDARSNVSFNPNMFINQYESQVTDVACTAVRIEFTGHMSNSPPR